MGSGGGIEQWVHDLDFSGVRNFKSLSIFYGRRNEQSGTVVGYEIWASPSVDDLPALWLGFTRDATDLILGGQGAQLGESFSVEELDAPKANVQHAKATYQCSRSQRVWD